MNKLLGFVIFAAGIALGYLTYYQFAHEKEWRDCGTVINKIDAYYPDVHKSHMTVEAKMYFDWKRSSTGEYIREEVGANTYYKFKVGQDFCFIRTEEPSGWWVIAMLATLVMVVAGIGFFFDS